MALRVLIFGIDTLDVVDKFVNKVIFLFTILR